jgi:NAD(P)-dependent dehydrogenase (short-subunit alcohol dehydrogenase family)
MTLEAKTVVVLGGSTGMGLATAKAAAAEGAQVVITGRSKEKLEAAVAQLPAGSRSAALDVADEAGTRSLFEQIGHVDHLFITAAAVTVGTTLASDSEVLRPSMDTRFWGSLYAARYGAAQMKNGGSITFMSGTSAWKPRPGGAVGSASCGAIEAFGRSLAIELAPIRVNTIAPGLIDTPLIEALVGEHKAALVEREVARQPVKRVGTPEDIADAVLFLMKNGYVTGITLTVDGGRMLI